MNAVLFILNAIVTLAVVAFLLRVLMPLVRADFRNPIGQAVLKFTNPLVMPLRRVMPPGKRFDLASLVALVIVQFAGVALMNAVAGGGLRLDALLIRTFFELVQTVLQFYFYCVLIYALLSWFAGGGYNPAQELLARLCEPLLGPVRRVIPPLGGLDFSALVVLIGLQALQIFLFR
jgi:YggT family protein